MAQLEKTLYSIDYPEFKNETCKGWTWSLCPTWKDPFKKCKQEYNVPCVMKRTSNLRIFIRLDYPDSLEPRIKQILNECHEKGARDAITVIASAAAVASTSGPQSAVAAAIASIKPAAETYGNSFWNCLYSVNIPNELRDQIKGNIYYNTKNLSNWQKV